MTLITPADTTPAGMPESTLRDTLYQAVAHLVADRAEEAIIACELALKIEPNCAEALLVLGLVSFELNEPAHALPLLARAQELQPDISEFTEALAVAYARVGNVNEGLFYAKLATTQPAHPLYPDLLPAQYRDFLSNLEDSKPHLYRHRAQRFLNENRPADAIDACQKQLDISPGDPDTFRLLARAGRLAGQVERAIAAGHATMHAGAQTPEDLSEIAASLTTAGRFDEAQACHAAARAMAPQDAALESRQLQDMLHSPHSSPETLERAHANWWRRHAAPLATERPPAKSESEPDRPLRIGYFCGNFSDSEHTRLFKSILEAHDRTQVEVYCYNDSRRSDLVSERVIHLADRWTDLVDVDTETAAEIVQGDAIDVAVDLTGHGEGNRMLTLAQSTVPVTVNWLNYHQPAGHDYFFANAATWPQTRPQPTFLGRIHHLEGPLASYISPAILPDVNELPAAVLGRTSFGIMGDLAIIDTTVAAKLKPLLDGLPNARLIIANKHDLDETCIHRTYEAFSHLGLRDRVDIVNCAENFSNEFDFYHHVDIALEVTHLTSIYETCRALWMGVPVLTLSGQAFPGRLASATLIDANCREWVCKDAADLASSGRLMALDLTALAATRKGLRDRVSASPLANAPGTARSLEAAYRQVWNERRQNND